MKRLFILLLSLAVCACGKTELAENSGNYDPYIPAEPDLDPEEDIFLQFCIREFDTDGDGEVSQYEADLVRSIDCSGMEIVKLTGIGKFSNLETLDCSNNRLTTLDLSQNRHLASLTCTRNALRKVTVAGCKELRTLDCAYNSLSSLDLSSASALQRVDCSNNSLSTLNVGGCFSLRTLDCSYNSLAALDLSKTAGIVTVTCKRNALASLLLTDCAELVSLDCSYNSLTKLDVTDCRKLSSLNCTDNPYLTELWLWGDQTISDLNKDHYTEIIYGSQLDPKPASTNFVRRVMVMQFTGTNCGYCPLMMTALRNLKANAEVADKFVIAACHSYNSSDPMYLGTGLSNAFGVSSYPSVVMDMRQMVSNSQESSVRNAIENNYNRIAPLCGIGVHSEVDGNMVVVHVAIKAAQEKQFRIGIMVLEDGIKATQSNYNSDLSGDFNTHNNTIRLIDGSRNYKGYDLGTIKAGSVVNQNFTLNLDSSWVKANCRLVVYACTDEGDGYCVNNVVETESLAVELPIRYAE